MTSELPTGLLAAVPAGGATEPLASAAAFATAGTPAQSPAGVTDDLASLVTAVEAESLQRQGVAVAPSSQRTFEEVVEENKALRKVLANQARHLKRKQMLVDSLRVYAAKDTEDLRRTIACLEKQVAEGPPPRVVHVPAAAESWTELRWMPSKGVGVSAAPAAAASPAVTDIAAPAPAPAAPPAPATPPSPAAAPPAAAVAVSPRPRITKDNYLEYPPPKLKMFPFPQRGSGSEPARWFQQMMGAAEAHELMLDQHAGRTVMWSEAWERAVRRYNRLRPEMLEKEREREKRRVRGSDAKNPERARKLARFMYV